MTFKIIAIIMVIISSAYSIVLEIVRYKSANNPTPANVADVYDAETYEKWKRYSAEHCILNLVSNIVACITTIVLLATNAFSAFASLFPQDWEIQLIAVILLEVLVGTVINIVVSYISTMVIEQKYGFNRSTHKTFIFDVIRSFIVSMILSLALAFGMSLLDISNYLVILFGVIVFSGTMFANLCYPLFSRIGNKFVPLEEGELKDKLMALLNKHGYKIRKIEVMDASRRTTKLNAYIAGLGKSKTIVLYDNLLDKMSTEEICAIFAHELGHGLHKDVLKRQILNIGYIALLSLTVLLAVIDPTIYAEFGFTEINFGFAYILTSIMLGVVQPLTNLVINAYSRKGEYEADKQAVLEGYGEHMITAFKKMAKDNFSNLSPSKLNVVLEYSHPPIHNRVEAVEKAMAELEQKD